MTPEEECALAREIIQLRSEWRTCVLRNPYAQREALAVYTSALKEGGAAMKRSLDTSENADAAAAALAEKLHTLDTLIRENTSCMHAPPDRHDPHAQSCADVASMMEEIKLSDKNVQMILKQMRTVLAQMEKHKQHWNNAPRCPSLAELITQHGVHPLRLASCVPKAEQSFASWKERRQKMFLAHVPRLSGFLKHFCTRYGTTFEELLSSAHIGLLRAIDKYDPERGVSLWPYARYWVKMCVQKAIGLDKTVRLSEHRLDNRRKILAYKRQYIIEEHNRQRPSVEEIGAALCLPPDDVICILRACHPAARLDARTSDGDALVDGLVDPNAPDSHTQTCQREVRAAIARALRALTPRERQVIIMRYGLGLQEEPRAPGASVVRFVLDEDQYGRAMFLEEVGEQLGLTRERIRQLESRGMQKLRESENPFFDPLRSHADV